MWVEVLIILMAFLPIEGSFISQMTIHLPDLLYLVQSTVYNHPLQGSTTSDVLAIGYGIQKDLSFTKRDHGIFAQEMDCYSSVNNAGEFLGSFVVTTYHLLVFDYSHGWGSHFGIGGAFDLTNLSSYSTSGMFISHPTFTIAPFAVAGSNTESISSYR